MEERKEPTVNRGHMYVMLSVMAMLDLFTHGYGSLENPWYRLFWSTMLLAVVLTFSGLSVREALRRRR